MPTAPSRDGTKRSIGLTKFAITLVTYFSRPTKTSFASRKALLHGEPFLLIVKLSYRFTDLPTLLGNGLCRCKQQQVIRAASLRVRSGHVEAAEGMGAHHRAGALAIEVEVADVEGTSSVLELAAGVGIDRAGETVLRVVGDLKRFFVMLHANHREHRPENLFLRDASVRRNICDHGRLNVVAALL